MNCHHYPLTDSLSSNSPENPQFLLPIGITLNIFNSVAVISNTAVFEDMIIQRVYLKPWYNMAHLHIISRLHCICSTSMITKVSLLRQIIILPVIKHSFFPVEADTTHTHTHTNYNFRYTKSFWTLLDK